MISEVQNTDVARVLREIALFLEMQEVPFKPRAYEKAAVSVESMTKPLVELYREGGVRAVEEIPGVGISIAGKIEELLRTGKVAYHEELKKKVPVDIKSFAEIEGMGPKTILKLYKELTIRNRDELEVAVRQGKLREVRGFGRRIEENILKGIEFQKTSIGRFSLGMVMPLARELEMRLRDCKEVERCVVAGSVRRRKETVGDIDILATAEKPKEVMDFFVSMPSVAQVHAHGATKSSVRLAWGLDADLRVVPAESYGAALNYFTGSKDHNVALRQLALKKKWKLNEYGLWRMVRGKEQMVAGKSEEELYAAFGMDYIEPELRENTGEVEAAAAHTLPKLIEYGALQGDLQMHSTWTDGRNSIEEMARGAAARGLKYIAITDHTKRLAMMHGLDEKRIKAQWKEIDAVNKKLGDVIRVLKGTECDILKDGSLDLPDSILKQLDVVGVSVHSYFNLPEEEQTARIIRAIRNPHVDILFHPTGRIVGRRAPYAVDMAKVIRTAKDAGTVLEVDSFERLDLSADHVRQCVDAGVKLSIDSDAHAPSHFAFLEDGIAQARRGWAEKGDIINAWPLEKMLKLLKS